MWPFSSPRNSYHETIAAKRARRTEAIKLAPTFNPEVHQKYLNATGNCTVILFACSCFRLLCASPIHASLTFFSIYFFDSARDCREDPGSHMDCFCRAGGLHRPRGTSAPSYELLHRGYAHALLPATTAPAGRGRTDAER
jgi:hypothetical protein